MATVLKAVLRERYLQTYEVFRDEYRKTADKLDSPVDAPSRSQYHRWLSGELKRLPHARHCRVLAEMFPELTPQDLFLPADRYEALKIGAAPRAVTVGQATLPALSGESRVVDAHTAIAIDINEQGHAAIEYRYEMVNLTDGPISRVPRAIWFKHVHSEIQIEPTQHGEHQVLIELLHDSQPHQKFAFRVSPAVEPGGRAVYGCRITGGHFLDEYFWRHSVLRYTDLMTMSVIHRGHGLRRTWATEEELDGSESLISKHVHWRIDDGNLYLDLERRDLKPTQVVELRWETDQP